MSDSHDDLLYYRACEYVLRTRSVSISRLQRHFRVGYRQANNWIERVEQNGFITLPKDSLH